MKPVTMAIRRKRGLQEIRSQELFWTGSLVGGGK